MNQRNPIIIIMRNLILKLFNFIFIVIEFICKNFFKLCLKILFKRYIVGFISILFFSWFIDINFINDLLFINDNPKTPIDNITRIRKAPNDPEIEIISHSETPEEKVIREERTRKELRHMLIQLERIGIFQDSRKNNIFHKFNLENMYENMKDEHDFNWDQEEELDELRMKLKDALNRRGVYFFLYCVFLFYVYDQITRDWWDR